MTKLEKSYKFYQMVNEILDLDSMNSVEEKVRAIVFETDNVLSNICQHADKIKIDLFEDAASNVKLDKQSWAEIVRLGYKVAYGKVNDKFIQRSTDKSRNAIYKTSMIKTFVDKYVKEGNKEALISENSFDALEIPNIPTYFNEDFNTYLTEAVSIRKHINKVLWPMFWSFWKAAYYVTNGELSKNEFKDLVDWEHYKYGGYPNDKSKPKLWAIYDKFDRAYRLMSKYQFPQLDSLNKKFGLDITLNEPSANRNKFGDC